MWAAKGWKSIIGLGALALMLGCSMAPNAALFSGPVVPRPVPVARVGPATTREGYPNVLVNPVAVPGVPKPPAEVASIENRLKATRSRTEAAASVPAPSHIAELQQRAATHAQKARRTIEASGKKPVEGTGAGPGV